MNVCSKLGKLLYLVSPLFIVAGLFGCATTQNATPPRPAAQTAAQTGKAVTPGPTQRPAAHGSVSIGNYFPTPERIDFGGEPIPLDNPEVRERFDREFTQIVYNHAQVYYWLKRKDRYFPWIEERLRRQNLPEDLKYLALAEREPPLRPSERTKLANAQFDFEISPENALQYLGDLYRNFKSWPLALAAYKDGEKRILEESRTQRQTDFYKMMLPEETERYVFRVLAIKAVLSDPTRYGYELPKGAAYP